MNQPSQSAAAARKTIRIFISYTKRDEAAAIRLLKFLTDAGFDTFGFQARFVGGMSVRNTIERQISECDFFILVLSEEAVKSSWVQEEIWLALQTQHANREDVGKAQNIDPCIFGFVAPGARSDYKIPLRDFRTHAPTGEDFSFADLVNFDDTVYQSDSFVEWMTPRVRFFGTDIRDAEELFRTEAFTTYERLFPNAEERDDPNDICQWLSEDSATEAAGGAQARSLISSRDWGSVCAILQVGPISVGFVYLTVHLSSGWIFGNYLCLLPCWRPHGKARWFLDEIHKHILAQFPRSKGIVFEVEQFQDPTIKSLLAKLKTGDHSFSDDEMEQIRAVMRVGLYQRQHPGALLVVNGSTKQPITYRQPAMRAPEDEGSDRAAWAKANEWKLWLMVWPLTDEVTNNFDLADVLSFIYIELFGKAYDPILSVGDFSYMRYVETLKQEIVEANSGGAALSSYLPNGGKALWSEIIRQGIRYMI